MQGQPQRRATLSVLRHADEPPGHSALEFIARGEERGVRSTVAKRHAETLRVPYHDVRAPFTWRVKQSQRQQIGGDDDQRAGSVGLLYERAVIVEIAVRRRVLEQHREERGALCREAERLMVPDDYGDANGGRARADDFDRLRVTGIGDEQGVPRFAAFQPVCHRHRLGGCGGFIQERRIGNLHAGEVGKRNRPGTR